MGGPCRVRPRGSPNVNGLYLPCKTAEGQSGTINVVTSSQLMPQLTMGLPHECRIKELQWYVKCETSHSYNVMWKIFLSEFVR